MPSKKYGHENTPENWAADYRFFITNSPAVIDPGEFIVGDFHWQLDEARQFRYPEEVHKLGYNARQFGAGGISFTEAAPKIRPLRKSYKRTCFLKVCQCHLAFGRNSFLSFLGNRKGSLSELQPTK
jgi:hypothetical protein